MFVTLTVSEIFNFFENCHKILKIHYLGYFLGFGGEKKFQILVARSPLILLPLKISVTQTVFELLEFFEFFLKIPLKNGFG